MAPRLGCNVNQDSGNVLKWNAVITSYLLGGSELPKFGTIVSKFHSSWLPVIISGVATEVRHTMSVKTHHQSMLLCFKGIFECLSPWNPIHSAWICCKMPHRHETPASPLTKSAQLRSSWSRGHVTGCSWQAGGGGGAHWWGGGDGTDGGWLGGF